MANSQTSSKKLAPPSKVISSKFNDVEGAKQAEIAAQITLPSDGGWGWVVLLASFCSICILDGLVFTYGSILNDIAVDLRTPVPLVALVGSLNFTLYLMLSPIASSFINRFGFRTCGMCGGIICCFSALTSTFAKDYTTFIAIYGVCHGIGSSFSSMAAYLVVGLYFQKYRTVALITVTSGSSIGMMILSPTNLILVNLAGWRSVVLLHSGLLGLIFFLAMTYRPLVSLTVSNTEDDATDSVRTVTTYLPNEKTPAGAKPTANAAERILGAVSNTRYPTAASVILETDHSLSPLPETSKQFSKATVTLSTSHGISQAQLKQVRRISHGAVHDRNRSLNIKIKNVHEPRKKSCWEHFCYWPSHVKSARPLYRDDAFYDGKMRNLPQYRKKMETGDVASKLEYQMEVSRAATVVDLNDQRHKVCTAAVKRVLATMFNVELLKMNSFKILCLAGVCNYLAILTPLTYLQHRNLQAGISAEHCRYFISVVGCFNVLGRVLWCFLSTKISPSYLYSGGLLIAGMTTMMSGLSYSLVYQYGYCALFGMGVSVSNAMRSLMIVDLYGLELLTNGTGMLLLFMGVGNLFSTPVAGVLKNNYGYDSAFYFAGICLTLGGIFSAPIRKLRNKEIKKQQRQEYEIEIQKRPPPPVYKKIEEVISEEHIPKIMKHKDSLPGLMLKSHSSDMHTHNRSDEPEHKISVL